MKVINCNSEVECYYYYDSLLLVCNPIWAMFTEIILPRESSYRLTVYTRYKICAKFVLCYCLLGNEAACKKRRREMEIDTEDELDKEKEPACVPKN